MAGSVEYLIENEVVPALHRIAVALEAMQRGTVLSDEEIAWTLKHGTPPPLKDKDKKAK
jgi:hypothetical protein